MLNSRRTDRVAGAAAEVAGVEAEVAGVEVAACRPDPLR